MITNSKIASGNQLASQMSDVASLIYLGKKYGHQVVFYKEFRHWRRGLQFFDVFDLPFRLLERCRKQSVEKYEAEIHGRRNDWQAWYQNADGLLQCDEKYYNEVSNSYDDFTKLDTYKNGLECDKNLEADLKNTEKNFDVLSGFGLMRSWDKNDYEYVVSQFKFKPEIKNIAAQKYINIQTTNNKQQTTNNKQQTTNNKQQTTNNKQQTVSVHLRRTDYIALASLNLGMEYYMSALKYFDCKKHRLLIFSDDIGFCKQLKIFNKFDTAYIEGNSAGVDLCLMSMCDHNIVANSSFSAWAARLNKNPNKIVICPYNWVGKADVVNQYLNGNWYERDWIALKAGQNKKNMRRYNNSKKWQFVFVEFARRVWLLLPYSLRQDLKKLVKK